MSPEPRQDIRELLIFINYRREDSAGYAGRLHDDLAERFPPEQLFIDVDAIPPGADFHASIGEAVGRCDALLALIGPRWLMAVDAAGRRRLDDPQDLVRAEIEAALERGVLVVPILVQGARMPKAAELPDGLKPLAKRNSLAMRDAGWRTDLEVLTTGLARLAALHPAARQGGESTAFWTSGPSEVELPYLGLRAFDESDARFFFGREADVEQLVARLGEHRFLSVFGPSGSGKSSLVKAGLVNALRQGAISGSKDWPIEVLRPGARPLDTLAAHLLALRPQDSMTRLVDALAGDERTLHLETVRALRDSPSGARYVWVIDQAEELFTLCRDEAQRAAAIANLVHAATVPGGLATVVLAMRADFYQRCAAYPPLAAAISQSQYLVSPMTESALRRAIEEPAKAVGLVFEPGLVDTIIQDVSERPGALPLLEHALLELFERRRGVTLTLEGYRATGGVDGALANRAESVYDDLDEANRRLVRRVLLRLTQPGEGSEDTRRRAAVRDLPASPGEADAVRHVIDELADARLITLGAGEGSGEPMLEIAHEALIRAWPRVRGWIDEDREGLRVHQRVVDATAEWERVNRADDALFRGVRLAEASEWQARHGDLLNDAERSFLGASVAAANREISARERRRRRTIVAALSLTGFFFLLSAITLAAWSGSQDALKRAQTAEATANDTISQLEAQRAELDRQRRTAIGRGLVSQATSPETPFDLSLLLALEGRRYAGADANSILLDTVYRWNPLASTIPPPDLAPGTEMAYSPDLQTLAFAQGQSVILRDVPTGKQHVLGSMNVIFRIGFAPDGHSLLVSGTLLSDVQGAVLWDIKTGRQTLLRANGWVVAWSFSADGATVATTGNAGQDEVVVWRTSDGGRTLTVPVGLESGLRSFALSRNHRFLAVERTGSAGTIGVDLWTVASGSHRQAFVDPDPIAGGAAANWPGIAFSPVDDTLAAVRGDPGLNVTVMLRDVGRPSSGWQSIELGAVDVQDLTFSPDGRTIAAAVLEYQNGVAGPGSPGGVFVVTALTTWREGGWDGRLYPSPLPLQHHPVFTVDGRRVYALSDAGALSVWTLAGSSAPGRMISLPGLRSTGANVLAIGPTGRVLAFQPGAQPGSVPELVRILDTATGRIRTLPDDSVTAVGFSANGDYLATASALDVRVLRMSDLSTVATLDVRGESRVTSVAISFDGSIVATSTADIGSPSDIRLWEPSSGKVHSTKLRAPELSLAFSSDGLTIAAGLAEGNGIELLDAPSLGVRTHLSVPSSIMSVAFHADGSGLVAIGDDDSLMTWDLSSDLVTSTSQTPTIVETAGSGATTNAASGGFRVSPDGSTIGSAGFAAWLYSVESLGQPVVDRACALAGRNLTTAEWDQYLPGEAYQRTCPNFP